MANHTSYRSLDPVRVSLRCGLPRYHARPPL